MRAEQRPVVEQEARRDDGAADDLFRPAVEVLVVRPAMRADAAEDGDQGGLPGATCTAGPLRVVGRIGRHVAHVDRGQVADVDPQLHRRRAYQHVERVVGRLELALDLLAVRTFHLAAVLLRDHGNGLIQRPAVFPAEVVVAQVLFGQHLARGGGADAQAAEGMHRAALPAGQMAGCLYAGEARSRRG